MRIHTDDECNGWLSGRERVTPDKDPGLVKASFRYPPAPGQICFAAQCIAQWVAYREPVLLWVTDWSICPSSENWHLYYKLRQSYGDHRLIHEAPGHLFLGCETEDLASFVHLAMLHGWDAYLLAHEDCINAALSNDEFVDFYAASEDRLTEIREAFEHWHSSGAE